MATLIERDLRYLAAEERLDGVLAELRESGALADGPEGAVVEDARRDGRLADPRIVLEVVAALLRPARRT